ncbi:tyrosine-type recombinase/integrase [Bacillus sp. EB600]|uniref:tyrosine-type recombinase/integrase n=1 Tax=Bacillus sp. EB600 TaxID=2806345 RepID=UPI00210D727C|nr:tyrosine-type recombinase/integrase [Bacillus sp. EB600]MCQ6282963.1 tyrosine-type recombinase/integrase [Bacillus sp. EB600]
MESQYHLIEQRLEILPWYITEFIEYKGRKNSEHTLLNYCRDFEIFFNWLVVEGITPSPIKNISLEVLEQLRPKDIVSFETHCSIRRENANDTIARRIAALKSLFHYLSQIAEDDNMYPYLKRNVMAKIDVVREKHSEDEKAEQIAGRILVNDEINSFREFVASEYANLVQDSKRIYNAHIRNRERDVAIISLILGSGLRVSEVVSLDMDKIDWNKQHVLVKRKGSKHEKVVFSDVALLDLLEYKANRFSKSSAQKMVEKYAEAFGKGDLTFHKLRHTFATQHYKTNKDIATLKRQLGHSNINTTMIYTHVFDNTLKDSVNNADK